MSTSTSNSKSTSTPNSMSTSTSISTTTPSPTSTPTRSFLAPAPTSTSTPTLKSNPKPTSPPPSRSTSSSSSAQRKAPATTASGSGPSTSLATAMRTVHLPAAARARHHRADRERRTKERRERKAEKKSMGVGIGASGGAPLERRERDGEGAKKSGTKTRMGRKAGTGAKSENEKEKEGVKQFFKDVLSFGQAASAPIIKTAISTAITTKTVVHTMTNHHEPVTTSDDPKHELPQFSICPQREGIYTPELPHELWAVILRFAAAPPFVPIPTAASLSPTGTGAPILNAHTDPSAAFRMAYPYSHPYPAALDATQLASPTSTAHINDNDPRRAALSPAVSFISAPPAHTQYRLRRAQYLEMWRARVALTAVCRVWYELAQEIVWQTVWIGSHKEGRRLAGRMCGDAAMGAGENASAGAEAEESRRERKSKKEGKKEGKKGKGKGGKGKSALTKYLEKTWANVGPAIFHIHIETRTMEKVSPHDLLIILAMCPRLRVFADYNSIRRPMHPLVLGSNEVAPFQSSRSSSSRIVTTNTNNNNFGTFTTVWAGNASAPSPPPKSAATEPLIFTSESEVDSDSDAFHNGGDGESDDEEHRHPFIPRAPSPGAHVHGFTTSSCPEPRAPSPGAHVHGFTTSSSLEPASLAAADALLQAILSRPLKYLTYTNYDYDDGLDVQSGIRYYHDVVEPRLRLVGGELEYLEVVLSAGNVGIGGREERAWSVGAGARSVRDGEAAFGGQRAGGSGGSTTGGLVRNPAAALYGAANMLTQLEASYTTTTTTSCMSPAAASASATSIGVISGLVSADINVLSLPSLRSLKATLDQATFKVLATWDMPHLTHLSVVAADFKYTGCGFRHFFQVHGDKLVQLELGHSSGEIEQYWITEPPRRAGDDEDDEGGDEDVVIDASGRRRRLIRLSTWCPNLKEFVCSADAEWSWETPDWISPHVLLPAHDGLEFIGVRGMSDRLMSDMDDHRRRHREPSRIDIHGNVHAGGRGVAPVTGPPSRTDPYFVLIQQFQSLLRRESFPRLRYLRDLCWQSDVIRRTGRMVSENSIRDASVQPPTATSLSQYTFMQTAASIPPPAATVSRHGKWWSSHATDGSGRVTDPASKTARIEAVARSNGAAVLRFWDAVLGMCSERGVWLEDCRGVNITRNDIQRAGDY